MSKVYESDINPDEFIRDFRKEPSGASLIPKAKENETPKESEPPKRQRPVKQSVQATAKDTAHPQTEEEYLDCFVKNMEHMRPLDRYIVVGINPKYLNKIKRVLSYESGSCSLKAYINNVLAEHFREYDTYIQKRQ